MEAKDKFEVEDGIAIVCAVSLIMFIVSIVCLIWCQDKETWGKLTLTFGILTFFTILLTKGETKDNTPNTKP